jgi:hypothetical protein
MFSVRGVKDAVTERSPAYAILGIDSEDRFKDYVEARAATLDTYNSSPYDFQITKNESMMNGFFTRLALTEINFPWMIPNINGKTREVGFEYQIGAAPAVSTTLTLDYGFTTPGEIATILQNAIRALDPGLSTFVMTYGTVQPSLANAESLPIFSYNPPLSVQVRFFPLTYNSSAYPFPPTTKQLFDVLGFSNANTILGGGELYGRGTYCQAIRYIDIVCSQLTYNQALKDTMSQTVARDTLCRLYIGDGPYTGTSTMDPSDADFCPPGCAPFTIYRQFTNPKFIRWLPNQPVQGNLRFQVFDDDGNLLSTSGSLGSETDGANWSMTLLVSED